MLPRETSQRCLEVAQASWDWDHNFCSNTSVLYWCFPIFVKLQVLTQWAWGRAEILQFPQAPSWCWCRCRGPLSKRRSGFFFQPRGHRGLVESGSQAWSWLGELHRRKRGKGKLRRLRGAISQGWMWRRTQKEEAGIWGVEGGKELTELKVGLGCWICSAGQIKNEWCSFQKLIYEHT